MNIGWSVWAVGTLWTELQTAHIICVLNPAQCVLQSQMLWFMTIPLACWPLHTMFVNGWGMDTSFGCTGIHISPFPLFYRKPCNILLSGVIVWPWRHNQRIDWRLQTGWRYHCFCERWNDRLRTVRWWRREVGHWMQIHKQTHNIVIWLATCLDYVDIGFVQLTSLTECVFASYHMLVIEMTVSLWRWRARWIVCSACYNHEVCSSQKWVVKWSTSEANSKWRYINVNIIIIIMILPLLLA